MESLAVILSVNSARRHQVRHGRIYSGHPRLNSIATSKTWMAGTSPAMTRFCLFDCYFCQPHHPGHSGKILSRIVHDAGSARGKPARDNLPSFE